MPNSELVSILTEKKKLSVVVVVGLPWTRLSLPVIPSTVHVEWIRVEVVTRLEMSHDKNFIKSLVRFQPSTDTHGPGGPTNPNIPLCFLAPPLSTTAVTLGLLG